MPRQKPVCPLGYVSWDLGDGVHGNSMKEPEMIVSSRKETLRRMSTDACLSGC